MINEDDFDRVHELKERLWLKVHELVDEELQGVPDLIGDRVREQLTEDFRFWKRE